MTRQEVGGEGGETKKNDGTKNDGTETRNKGGKKKKKVWRLPWKCDEIDFLSLGKGEEG